MENSQNISQMNEKLQKKVLEINFGYSDLCRELVQNADAIQVYEDKLAKIKIIKYSYTGDFNVDYIYTTENYERCVYVTVYYHDNIEINDDILDALLQHVEKLALDILEFPWDVLELPERLRRMIPGVRTQKLK